MPSKLKERAIPIFTIASDQCITIAGQRGTGKSTLSKFILKKFNTVLVWDPHNQHGEFNHYVPQSSDIKGEFDYICQKVWERGNILFCVEEAEQIIREGSYLKDYVFKIINMGRNRGIGLIAITPSIALLSKDYFRQCQHVYIFKFFTQNDKDYLKGFLGRDWAWRICGGKPLLDGKGKFIFDEYGNQKTSGGLPKFHFVYSDLSENICECEPLRI